MHSDAEQLECAAKSADPGRWLVGVSGGLDSVALLFLLLRHRPDITPIVAHLDHQTRGAESDRDREFVGELCLRLGVECVVSRLDQWGEIPEPNLEARLREARLRFFSREVPARAALGVLVAQHADDRAETVLLRLLRGGEPWALDGLRRDRLHGPLRIVRPLLGVRRSQLHSFLVGIGEGWREDLSNRDFAFARNRVRGFLKLHPQWIDHLLRLGDAADSLRNWVEANAPQLPESVPLSTLADLPEALARHALRKWLARSGVESTLILPAHVDRLQQMALDRATPAVFELPGGISVRRSRGQIALRAK